MTGKKLGNQAKRSEPSSVTPVLPDYGVFLRAPANGSDWIHPEDHAVVQGMVPSHRVVCRYRYHDGFYHFRYGTIRFRLRPCLWLPLRSEGFDIGDRVETTGVGLSQELFVSEIIGMVFDDRAGEIRYQLARTPTSGKLFSGGQLRLLEEKVKLREGTTIHPTPKWNDAFRDAYSKEEYLGADLEDQ